MKKFNLKRISQAVSTALITTALGVFPNVVQASDIEIYQIPKSGKKTVVMMLDTSGSMTDCDGIKDSRGVSYNTDPRGSSMSIWDYPGGGGYVSEKIEKSGGVSYTLKYCNIPGLKDQPSRATSLISALYALIDSNALDDSLVLGIGVFHNVRASTGRIDIPAEPLTPQHRQKIRDYLKTVTFAGATPTATSYAEVAAYMMGTSTASVSLVDFDAPKEITYPMQIRANPSAPWQWTNALCTSWNHSGLGCMNRNPNSYQPDSYYESDPSRYVKAECAFFVSLDCWRDKRDTKKVKAPAYMINRNLGYLGPTTYADFIGFNYSHANTKLGSNYKSPLPTEKIERGCSGQAIYFLTDGYPNSVYESQHVMRAVLGNKAGDFPEDASAYRSADTVSAIRNANGYLNAPTSEGMAQASELAKRLRDATRNPAGVSIKTAVVGFGAAFDEAEQYRTVVSTTNPDTGKVTTRSYYDCSKIRRREVRNACYWGAKSFTNNGSKFEAGYGEGGFFYAKNSEDVINSLLQVVDDVETKSGEVATGSPSIPFDPLNFDLTNKAYYSAFTPRPQNQQQLWTGYMNKYDVDEGRLLVGANKQPLIEADGTLNKTALGLWDETVSTKGTLGRLVLKASTGRKVWTDREVLSGGTTQASTTLQTVDVNALLSGKFKEDKDVNYWLNFLGYAVPETGTPTQADVLKAPELRQLGAVMHSQPLLITQRAEVVKGSVATEMVDGKLQEKREDFVVYGSTQGALHVIDAKNGKEKFAFVPHEMMSKYKKAFLPENATTGGRGQLFYGIDAQWVSHSVYDKEQNSNYSTVKPQPNSEAGAHQWLYGGLRMGGKSYYGLDFTDIDTPKMLFHINPEENVVRSAKATTQYTELQFMGQSWSKPALGYVNWHDGKEVKRKLVMFVGGGYDVGYEEADYKQTNGVGAGVYMFDAETGQLLWWASSHPAQNSRGVEYTYNENLKYSVVSRINAIDIDQDGLLDAIYFGDLAGQGFRFDFKNNITTNADFAVRGVRLFSEYNANGVNPRFYEMPSLSVYTQDTSKGGDGKPFLVAGFASGNRSSPLAGTNKDISGNDVVTPTVLDAMYVVYDNDVGRLDILDKTIKMITENGKFLVADLVKGVPQMAEGKYNFGWKYQPQALAGEKKFFDEPYTIKSQLFVNSYNKDNQGTTSDAECGAGVRGNTTLLSVCLPTGKCETTVHGHDGGPANRKNMANESIPRGIGISTSTLGGDGKGGFHQTGGQGRINCNASAETRALPECQSGTGGATINQLRWYESN